MEKVTSESSRDPQAWEIYYNYHPVIFIFFNFLYLQMKYGPDRFNRNPRGSRRRRR